MGPHRGRGHERRQRVGGADQDAVVVEPPARDEPDRVAVGCGQGRRGHRLGPTQRPGTWRLVAVAGHGGVAGTDDAVARREGFEHGPGDPRMRRRHLFDLVPDLGHGLDPEVAAETRRQLGGDHPVGPALARGHQLLREPAHPALDVGRRPRPFVDDGGGQHHVGPGG